MCGIVGYVGNDDNCVRILINGLKRLDYRGYDSAGIAYFKNGEINIIKSSGKLVNLKNKVDLNDNSNIGIGHTRWATHGNATTTNSHPHKAGKFTIVHNGIIENHEELKKCLEKRGYVFLSETDSEVIAALLDYLYKSEKDMVKVIEDAKKMMNGTYAVGIICDDVKDELYAVRNSSPLIVGFGEKENYIASDLSAILDKTKKYVTLENDDVAILSPENVDIYKDGVKKSYDVKTTSYTDDEVSKNGYEYFMLKEINEQPEVFKRTLLDYVNTSYSNFLDSMPDLTKYKKIRIVACGSATHAGLVGKQMIERFANVKTEVETASEFRYNPLFLDDDELVIVISQSGETMDTLKALERAKENKNDTLGIINARESSIARESDYVLYTNAGKEVAVATTKAYSAQVLVLTLIAMNLAYKKKIFTSDEIRNILTEAKEIPNKMEYVLSDHRYKEIAEKIKDQNDVFFIGRGVDYALAQEGSLKLKEISYVHSEAYAAGELKHGTISLIENQTPVVAVITDDRIAAKTISNIKEVKARGAYVICITNDDYDLSCADEVIKVPKTNDLFAPLLSVIPLQTIAYELAKIKGNDVDKPRNLAKSVTVE